MSDQEQEEYEAWINRERPHKFKKLSRALADVEVQQLKAKIPLRDAPGEGHKSFISEEILQRKDTVGAKHWVEAVAALNDSVQSLELVVVQRDTILSILLQQANPAAKLSLPALLAVLTAFSKDLQADFVPFCPRVFEHMAMLATNFARDAELLEVIFSNVANLLKNIHKHLQSKIPWVLRVSRDLRYHSAQHIRVFAAEAFGYLLRKAPLKKLPKAVAAAVSEGVATSDMERVHGAAHLLAVSILGPSHTLHSRAEPLSAALFSMQSLDSNSNHPVPALQTAIGQRRLAALIITALDRLLDHTRRDRGASLLWEVSIAAVTSALSHTATLDANAPTPASKEPDAGKPGAPEPASPSAVLAHSIAAVCHAVEYMRGSRVDDYTPLFRLLETLIHDPHAWPQAPNSGALHLQDEDQLPVLVVTNSDATAEASALATATAPQQVLRLALGLIHAHGKVAGASGGPEALREGLSGNAWTALFMHAAPKDLYAFASALLQPPTCTEALGMFVQPLVAALTCCVHACGGDYVMMDVPLGLLAEVLSRAPLSGGSLQGGLLEGEESNSQNEKVLEVLGNVLETFLDSEDIQQNLIVNDSRAAAAAVAALQCMARMHAATDQSSRILSLSQAAFDKMYARLTRHAKSNESIDSGSHSITQKVGAEGSSSVAHLNTASVLLSATQSLLTCSLVPRVSSGQPGPPVDTVAIARQVVELLAQQPGSYVLLVALASVAETLGCVRMRHVMSTEQRYALRDALASNLVSCSRATRVANLRVILRCEPYISPSLSGNGDGGYSAGNDDGSDEAGVQQATGGAFVQGFLDCEEREMDLAGGRAAIAWLKRVTSNLEYGKVPAAQVALVVRCLLGMSFIKYSELRQPLAGALAAAIEHQPDNTWPVFLGFLRRIQDEFFCVTSPPVSSIPPSAPLHPQALTPEHPPFSLRRIFHVTACSGSSEASGGFMDCSSVLGMLLTALSVAPAQCIERKHALWHALATTVIASSAHEHTTPNEAIETPCLDKEGAASEEAQMEASEAGNVPEASGPRAKHLRARLADWLQLIARLKGTKNFQKAQEWPPLITPHLSSIDPLVQRAALNALTTLQHPKALTHYVRQITAMTEPKRIKGALLRFPLETGADNGIADSDRREVLPIVLRVLLPLLRRRSGRKGASDVSAPPASARPAVLNRLAALESLELSTLVQLSLEPHSHLFSPTPPASLPIHADPDAATLASSGETGNAVIVTGGAQTPWWHDKLACADAAVWLEAVTVDSVAKCPLGRRKALLNTIGDLISHLGFRMQPFLPLLATLVVRTLQAACGHNSQHACGELPACTKPPVDTGDRAQRSASIQLLATVLTRFPVAANWQPLWPEVLPVLVPLAATLADDSAAGGKSPSVLTLVHALATAPALLTVLADRQSMHEPPAFLQRMEEDSRVKCRGARIHDARMISMHGDSDEELESDKENDEDAKDAGGHSEEEIEEEGSDSNDEMHEDQKESDKQLKATRRSTETELLDDLSAEAVDVAVPVCDEDWARQCCGSKMVASAVDAFSRPGTTARVRNAAFLVLEALASVHRPGAKLVLARHALQLLPALQAQLERSVEGVSAARCVGLLHKLVPLVEDSAGSVVPLSQALAAAAAGRRGGERRSAAALSALATLWRRCNSSSNTQTTPSNTSTVAANTQPASLPTKHKTTTPTSAARARAGDGEGMEASRTSSEAARAAVVTAAAHLAPLGARLETRDARSALADAIAAACIHEPDLSAGAKILAQVTSFSTTALDEADYDARLAGYSGLTVDTWRSLPALSASFAMHACFTDLRAPDDLALRSAAASALASMIDSAADSSTVSVPNGSPTARKSEENGAVHACDNDVPMHDADALQGVQQTGGTVQSDVLRLVTTRLYRQLLSLSLSEVLVVRQEALTLLRRCATVLPAAFPDLVALSHADPEADFFLNVAHIQLHRRARAFYRLSVAISASEPSPAPSGTLRKNGAANGKAIGNASTADAAPSKLRESENPETSRKPREEGGVRGILSLGTLQALVVPLIVAVIKENRGAPAGAGGHGIKKGTADRAQNIVDAAVQALHAVASRLAWPQYRNILSRFLNLAGGGGRGGGHKGDAADIVQRNSLRAVCAIIDAFHFVAPGERLDTAAFVATDKATLAAQSAKNISLDGQQALNGCSVHDGNQDDTGTAKVALANDENMAGDEEAGLEADTEAGDQGNSGLGASKGSTAAAIQETIVLRVLPSMLRLMHKDKDTVRAPVALAIVKLIRILPEASEGMHLTKVLQNVANLLAEKLQSTRDGARAVLVDILKELGPDYMQPVASVLSAALPARGLTAHVLGYTLHACLQALVDIGSEAGALDHCLEELLPLMEAGLFTSIAEQKKAAAYASKHRETKSQKAYVTYESLAQLCTFSTHAEVLLLPVRERMADAATPQIRNILVKLLQHASQGVAANAHACSDDVMIFAYRQLKRSAAADEAQKALEASVVYADAGPQEGAKSAAAGAAAGAEQGKEAWQPNEEIITEFALSILSQWVRKGKLDVANDPHTRSRMDPLLPKLAGGVALRSTACAQLCLKCLTGLVAAGLPGMPAAAQRTSKPLWKILSNRQRLDSHLSQDCLKFVAALLRKCGEWQPPVEELRALVGGAYADITTASASLLGLLRAVLDRKLVEVIEVYDVMKRVQEQLVQNPDSSMRSSCAAALLQFLLDWPLKDHRLTQHLEFILSNLAFEIEDGRLQVLEFVEVMINKFPAAAVDSRFAVFFVPLAQRLQPETSPECRRRLAGTISALLQRCTAASRRVAAEWCVKWLQSWDGRMRTVSAQLLGILASVEGQAFNKRLPAIKAVLLEKLQAASSVQSTVAGDDTEGLRSAPGWREAYLLVQVIEKVFSATPKSLLISEDEEGVQNEQIWRAVLSLLSHRHFWVQKGACRCFSAALAHAPIATKLMALPKLPACAALELFSHFEACGSDAGAATQAVKSLAATASFVYDAEIWENSGGLAQLGELKSKRRRMQEEGQDRNGQYETHTANGEAADVDSDADDNGDSSEEEDEEVQHAEHGDMHEEGDEAPQARMRAVTLRGLFKRVGKYAADRRESVQILRIGALQWLAAVCRRLGGQKLAAHDSVLLFAAAKPLYQIQENAGLDGEQVTEWAAQVTEVLREGVGAEALAAAMNTARGAMSTAKAKRKRAVALQAVVDPEAAAQRRLKRNEKRAGERKRKSALEKRQRDAGVATSGKRSSYRERDQNGPRLAPAGGAAHKKHKRRERRSTDARAFAISALGE